MNRTRMALMAGAVALLVVGILSALLIDDGEPVASSAPTSAGEISGGPSEEPNPAAPRGEVDRRQAESSGGVDVEDARAPTTADAGAARATPGARGSLLVDDAPRSDPTQAAGTASTLDKEAVKRGIAAAKPKIVACYESALKVQPELMGRIVVEFKIEASADGGGAVTSGEVTDTDVASPFFEACVLKEVAGTPFDAPSGAGTVTVRYPFHFENNADEPSAQPDAGPR